MKVNGKGAADLLEFIVSDLSSRIFSTSLTLKPTCFVRAVIARSVLGDKAPLTIEMVHSTIPTFEPMCLANWMEVGFRSLDLAL